MIKKKPFASTSRLYGNGNASAEIAHTLKQKMGQIYNRPPAEKPAFCWCPRKAKYYQHEPKKQW